MKQKTVLRVCFNCRKCKTAVLKAVAKLEGIDSVAVDAEKWTLTVVGNVDPVRLAEQIRKIGKGAEIMSVEPPKPNPPEPKKKPEVELNPLPTCCKECHLVVVRYFPYEGGFCSIL
ncbi:unnamed protein product [Ilex paraguariensis]|uniref:HMA domain-containing protein n=1 Tax=Ilex paraguariensis TaxID=185542 RepID=A0ABC8UT04_9AQUA